MSARSCPDIPSIGADVRLVPCDVALVLGARSLRGIVMPQVHLIRANVAAVPPDVATVSANIRPVAPDVPPITTYIVTMVVAAIGLTAWLLIAPIRARSKMLGVQWRAGL
jgi:hypothetical protein